MTDLTLPPCPTACDDDCELNPDGCHESHQVDYKRTHQPWACHDLRVTMAEYAARMIEQYARRPLPGRLSAPAVVVNAREQAAVRKGTASEPGGLQAATGPGGAA
jgi:hypothetical protein